MQYLSVILQRIRAGFTRVPGRRPQHRRICELPGAYRDRSANAIVVDESACDSRTGVSPMRATRAVNGAHHGTDTTSARSGWRAFLQLFLKNPRRVASVAPSSRSLGRLMAAALPQHAERVIELGPGSGTITDALLCAGVRSPDLLLIERDPNFCRMLRARLPEVTTIYGDACNIAALCAQWRGSGRIDAVCSSLGLLAMPSEVRQAIVAAAFDVLDRDGVFIQYTYGFKSPLGAEIRRRLSLGCIAAGFTWRNLPPARVFVYRRERSVP